MSNMGTLNSTRPDFDELIKKIADYTLNGIIDSPLAYETARHCFIDSMGCALLALKYPQCTRLLGPIVPEATMSGGCRVPGTNFELDPPQAAFNIGTMIRWLDYNDTWLAAEWGHPSDNLGAILASADYLSRKNQRQGKPGLSMKDILTYMIKAHEIQGILALNTCFNRVGLDHVLLVRIASTAVATAILGGTKEHIQNALSHAFIDGGALRTYRHAPNTGSRKSWAAGDATSRAVNLALKSLTGEMGYPSALTANFWGFQDTLFKNKTISLERKLGSYVMENILFKISFPAEFHAQTAVEAALILHPLVKNRLEEISRIDLYTQESGFRIINKTGPLSNPADRDHCLQYMVAIPLIFGELTADHYEDKVAADVRIDCLRQLMFCEEDSLFSREYLDPKKRSIANAIQISFTDGTSTGRVEIRYPVGHRRRREEGIPLLIEKFSRNIKTVLASENCQKLEKICNEQELFMHTSLDDMMKILTGISS